MSVAFDTSAIMKQVEEKASAKLKQAADTYVEKMQQLMAYERNVHNTEVLAWSKHKNVHGQLLPDDVMPSVTVEGEGLEYDVKVSAPNLSGLNEFQRRGYEICFANIRAKLKGRKFGGDA